MGICPSCGKAELDELVPGVMSCPACRKMFRGEIKQEEKKKAESELKDGEFFMKNTSLNPKWEVCDKGITVAREENKSWLAVLICHSPDFPNSKYMRISWWKKSINAHAGMFKITELDELENAIIALERIDDEFDDTFNPKLDHQISFSPLPERANIEDQSFVFNVDKRICPKCKFKMKRSKNKRYFECERCGEIIVLDEGHPIFDYPSSALPLNFSTNYPVNFYLPSYGITVRSTMADWKAIVLIYPKENPEKKWLRFYWWQRNLQSYMTSEYSLGNTQGLRWETKKGVMSPNIYEKEHLSKLISALKIMKDEWLKYKTNSVADRDVALPNKTEKGKKTNDDSNIDHSDVSVPDIRSKKADVVHWILDNAPADSYVKSELIKMKKTELISEVRKVSKLQKET